MLIFVLMQDKKTNETSKELFVTVLSTKMKRLLINFALIFFLYHSVASQTCNMQNNKDISGNDYYNVQAQQGDCCQICYNSYYCRAFSWTNFNGGTCWLKYSASPVVDGSNVNLGISDGSTCSSQEDSDISGQDLQGVNGQPESSCCSICSSVQGCNAYSWNNYNGGTCWLKTATGPIISNPGVSVGALCIGGGCSSAQSVGCGSGWQIFKQYSFNSMDQVNQDWDIMIWPPGTVNNELEAYTNSGSNLFIKNNHLVIRALRSNNQYTSGRVQSKQLFTPNGVPGNKLKVEFTATVPSAMGAWPAVWMCGVDGQYGPNWPLNGEIDVMEWVWQLQNDVKSSLHWKSGNDWSQDFTNQVNIRELSTTFITYGVEYSTVSGDEYIQFYIRKPSGQTIYVNKATPSDWDSSFSGNCEPNCPPMAPFDAKMQLIMNIAIGGDWGGCCGVQGYDIFDTGVEMEISAVNVCMLA